MSTTTENICRTCLSTDGELISLFSGPSETARLTSKIMNISDVTINRQDGLPNMICKKCIFLVESFDCFKKQIQSANKKIEKVWRMDDSDYEIQYISDEVKREVENAFRRKQETTRQRELPDIRTTPREIRDAVPVPIEEIIDGGACWEKANINEESSRHSDEKDTETNITCSLFPQFAEEAERADCPATEAKSHCDSPEARFTTESADTTKRDGFQAEYSDCSARLVIVMEEPEDREIKGSEDEEENSVPEGRQEREDLKLEQHFDLNENAAADEAKDILRESSDSGDRVEGSKYFEPAETNNRHFSDAKDGAISEPVKRNDEETGSSKFENGTSADETIPPCNGDFVGATSLPNKLNRRESTGIGIEVSEVRYAEDPMSIENSLSIGEEVVESERFDENANEASKTVLGRVEEERMDVRDDLHRTDVHPEIPDDVKDDRLANRDAIQRPTSGATRERFVDSHGDEKIAQPTKQLISVKKCYDKKFDDCSSARERIHAENGTSGAETRVIVISSDSSDEERRKNHPSTKQRKARKKLFPSRLLPVRKSIQDKRTSNKECAKEPPTNLQSKLFQPRKYFQCTSCNVNLYSVSAVLHHHNQIHTPPQELMHCMMCDVKFPTKTILRAHFDQHVESHLFRCTYCTCEFVLRRNLRAHMNAHAVPPKIEEQPETKRQRIADAELPAQREFPTNDEILPATKPNENGEQRGDRTSPDA